MLFNDIGPHRRIRAFRGDDDRAAVAGYFFRAMAGDARAERWCVEHSIPLVKAQSEGSNSVGGFLLPDDVAREVFALRETVGALRIGAQTAQLTTASQVRPRRYGGATAYWVNEGDAITESSVVFDAIEATPRKLGTLIKFSSELGEDAVPDLGRFLTAEMANSFAAAEDDAGFNGDGSSSYGNTLGLTTRLAGTKSNVAAASGHNTFGTIDAADLGDLVAGVMGTAINTGAAWFAHPIAFGKTFARLAASGQLIVQPQADGTLRPYFMGVPVHFSAKLTDASASSTGKAMIFFGALSLSTVIAERRAVTVAFSRQRGLEVDQIWLRATQRVHIINHDVGDASTRGPIAALIGTA